MIDDHPDLERRYRAPRAFGPMPGPRNLPLSERDVAGRPPEVTTSLAVTLEADPDQLSRLLPSGTRLSGPAELTVTATRFDNLRWLAGRGYPILTVTFPVVVRGESGEDDVVARYLPVLWEGLPDPVTTGREELAFPKLFANIEAPAIEHVSADGAATAEASWDGFRFVELSAGELRDVAPAETDLLLGTLVHRFVPSLGAPDRADIDHLVLHTRSVPHVTDRRVGTGRFSFHHARFADVPVQYPVINALADLTLSASGPATLTRSISTTGAAPGSIAPRLIGGGLPRAETVNR